jgi:hypothetical protein
MTFIQKLFIALLKKETVREVVVLTRRRQLQRESLFPN